MTLQAVILAGGKGTRLAERLGGKPKPLVDVCGKPLLGIQIEALIANGVRDIVILVNHEAEQIQAYIDGANFDCRITLVDDGEPKGTAGATLATLDILHDTFLVVYGDTLFDIDIQHMLKRHTENEAEITLFLHPNDHPADSDLVEIDAAGWVTAFHPYPHPPRSLLRNLVNAAFYVIDKKSLIPWSGRTDFPDFAKHLFPEMLRNGARIHGYVSYEYIKDLGTPKRLDKVERHLWNGVAARARRDQKQKAVFLDRDGTLNALRDYVRKPDDLEVFGMAGEAIRKLNEAEYRVVVITNQPVLARGESTDAQMRLIHGKLEQDLGAKGAYLDALYLCPHHPHRGFPGEVAELKRDCSCRKPGTELIEKAVRDLNIDLTRSWMIGDSSADIAMAERAGLTSILVRTGESGQDGKWPATPDHVADDVGQAVNIVLKNWQRAGEASE